MGLNFSISELIASDTAARHNINNMPDIRSLDCMLELIFYVLQPLREIIKKPMTITSGYRNKQVNQLVGGAVDKWGNPTSQHSFGQAADVVIKGITPAEFIEVVKKSGIEYDQLINEHDSWTHISFNKGKNRKQCFKIP